MLGRCTRQRAWSSGLNGELSSTPSLPPWTAFQVQCRHSVLPHYHVSLWRVSSQLPVPTCHPLICWKRQNELNFLPVPNFSPPATEPPAFSKTLSNQELEFRHTYLLVLKSRVTQLSGTLSPRSRSSVRAVCGCLLSGRLDIQWG